MSDEAIRIAMGLRVGAPLGQPHQCSHCGSDDQFFRHGLSCRFSQGTLSCHNTVNSLIQHALTAAKIPSRLEPSGLHRDMGSASTTDITHCVCSEELSLDIRIHHTAYTVDIGHL